MRIRPLIVLVCALALGAVVAVRLGRDADDPTAGPIDSSQNGLGYSQPLEVGQDFSIGITTLRNRGKRPAVVERVRLLGVTGALELLPVPKPFNPTSGDSYEGLELVIGIRATRPGISAYRAVEVQYLGDRDYREIYEANAVHLCAPLAEYVDLASSRSIQDCPPRELEDKFEDGTLEWPLPSER